MFVLRRLSGRSWVVRGLRRACLLGTLIIGSLHGIVPPCSYSCARILRLTSHGIISWAHLLTPFLLCSAPCARNDLPSTCTRRNYTSPPATVCPSLFGHRPSRLSFGPTEMHADVQSSCRVMHNSHSGRAPSCCPGLAIPRHGLHPHHDGIPLLARLDCPAHFFWLGARVLLIQGACVLG